MSFYSSNDVKNELLEPSVHNASDRTEFRIHGDVLPSLKLINNGRFGNAGAQYNDLVGVLGNIKNIFIYDGKVELSSIRDFNEVMGFKNLQYNNHHNSDIDRLLKRHKIGFQSAYLNTTARYERKTEIKNDVNNTFPATDAIDNVKRSYFDLREAFNMLQKVPVLTDKVFKQLRVVLEYSRTVQDSQTPINLACENCRPLLGLDRVVNPVVAMNLANSLSVLNYTDIEHDRVNVSAIAQADGVVKQSRKVLGFNGKLVGRIRVAKRFLTETDNLNGNDVVSYGKYRSINNNNEVFQLNVNGRPLFPRAGVEGENRRLALLVDTHGEMNLYEDAHLYLHADYVNKSLAGDNSDEGAFDFFATEIDERVNELQLDYTRESKTDTTTPSRYNSALLLKITAEVQKVLQVGNGTYNIQYA